jgi:hypothetical protein
MEVLELQESTSEHETANEKKVTRDPVSKVLELFPGIKLLLRKDIYKNQMGQLARG